MVRIGKNPVLLYCPAGHHFHSSVDETAFRLSLLRNVSNLEDMCDYVFCGYVFSKYSTNALSSVRGPPDAFVILPFQAARKG